MNIDIIINDYILVQDNKHDNDIYDKKIRRNNHNFNGVYIS